MKKRNFIHLAVALIFIYFSYVQLNDTDGLKWIIIYSSISLLAFMKFIDMRMNLLVYAIAATMLGLVIFNFNLYTNWTNAGRPAFIDYEPTYIQEVEDIREFLGLIIACLTSLVYVALVRKKEEKA